MAAREYIKAQADTLPDFALTKIMEFIRFQRFTLGLDEDDYEDETTYLLSVPGMANKIDMALAEPLTDAVLIEEVWKCGTFTR
jgi:hypothetical protein